MKQRVVQLIVTLIPLVTIAAAVLALMAAWALPALGRIEPRQSGAETGKVGLPPIVADVSPAVADPGESLVLRVTESITAKRTFTVVDSAGLTWAALSDDGESAEFGAVADTVGGTVTVTMRRTRDGATTTTTTSYAVRQPRWPGHQPGRLVLGMSCGTVCPQRQVELGRNYGVHRQFFGWGDWQSMAGAIDADHAAGRLPWVSFKPPSGGAAGWTAIAGGSVDPELRGLATMLKAHDTKPVLITFAHEPSNDGTEKQGALWAAAYCHVHDLLAAEGALVRVADPPIVGDWLFNPANTAQDPANWLANRVLQRAPFLGVDLYENASGDTFAQRIPLIRAWLASRGFGTLMVGIGETGATDAAYPARSAVAWINESLAWAVAHPGIVGVVSYFNSTANSRDGVYWPLDESAAKLAAYRSWLDTVDTPAS